MAKRKLTLQVHEIESRTTQVKEPKFAKLIFNILNSSLTIKDRFMEYHQEDGVISNQDEGDFIPYFNHSNGFLFGSFVRLRPGEGTNVSNIHLTQKTVSMNEMVKLSDEESAGSIKDYIFFCIYEGYLIMTSAKNNRKALETYFNWLLRENKKGQYECSITPKHKTENTIPMGDIQKIQIAEGYFQNKLSKEETKILQVKRAVLQNMLKDIKDLKALELEDVLTATIHLKINKKELKKKDGKALDTLLRIVDSEDVIIKGKGAKTLKGTDYLIKIERQFEHIGKSFNEPEIETEMRKILKDIDNGKVVN